MLHEFLSANRDELIRRCRAKVSKRDSPPVTASELEYGVPLFLGQLVEALRYAETLSDDVRAVYVDVDPVGTEAVKKDWETWGGRVKLVILQSPYRSLMEPLLEYIEQTENERADDYVTVILPEFVPAKWWQHLFHNQRALLIKGALLFRPNTVVTSVPFHLSK